MTNARMMGYALKKAVNNRTEIENEIKTVVGLSDNDLERLYVGRVFLPYKDLTKICDIVGISIMDLLEVDEDDYNRNVVHCEKPFANNKNREFVLDIIDAYIDIKEAVEAQ